MIVIRIERVVEEMEEEEEDMRIVRGNEGGGTGRE